MEQKNSFLSGEGDKYFIRNKKVGISPEIKFLTSYLKNQRIKKMLEIGCSSGRKAKILSRKLHSDCYGLDPSKLAIKKAKVFNLAKIRKFFGLREFYFEIGTSDKLNFAEEYFDFIYFGFSLYLVDRELLEVSLSEADRCLKPGGFLAIKDFDFGSKKINDYKHLTGIKSFKEDYTQYFISLGYKLVSKESYISNRIGFELDPDNRISVWLLYKSKQKDSIQI